MFHGGESLKKFETLIENSIEKKLSIARIIIGDPLITPIEKEFIQELIELLSTIYPEQNLQLCFNNTRVLTREERKNIGYWNGMDKEIIKYVKKFPIFQLEKTTRIKNQAESIIPEIPTKPNAKIAIKISYLNLKYN